VATTGRAVKQEIERGDGESAASGKGVSDLASKKEPQSA
jgi:hypothetical protein